MLAPLLTLLAITEYDNPFPVMLGLSAAAIVAFGAELVIARLRVHPRRWLYVLLASGVAFGVILAAWSGYYTLYGPPSAAPNRFHPSTTAAYFQFYGNVWKANIVIITVAITLVLATGLVLRRQWQRT